MDCVVCGKPVQIIGADTCSTRCMLQGSKSDSDKEGRRANSGFSITGKLTQASLRLPQPELEVPMLKIAHRWIKNRNIVEGGTIFSFDSNGVALVKDLNNARVDIERLLKKPTGKFFIPEEKVPETKIEEVLVPVVSVPLPPVAASPEVLTSAVVSEPEEPKEEIVVVMEDEEEKATKRTPAKKKIGGKKE